MKPYTIDEILSRNGRNLFDKPNLWHTYDDVPNNKEQHAEELCGYLSDLEEDTDEDIIDASSEFKFFVSKFTRESKFIVDDVCNQCFSQGIIFYDRENGLGDRPKMILEFSPSRRFNVMIYDESGNLIDKMVDEDFHQIIYFINDNFARTSVRAEKAHIAHYRFRQAEGRDLASYGYEMNIWHQHPEVTYDEQPVPFRFNIVDQLSFTHDENGREQRIFSIDLMSQTKDTDTFERIMEISKHVIPNLIAK